ncbi:hypothetical protein BR93DRAFT_937905 [Coniochaeta sp. PMI_546]|nr:hypothetical protein BR93DRAFT_937905 [Coniochaeta sp. PMI_546]
MDVAYNQHAGHVRRKNRSTTNLNRLSLAPLTSKLPLDDGTDLDDYHAEPLSAPPSYLQGKSAPTTPRLLSRSPGPFPRSTRSKSHTRGTSTPVALPKSKSTTHLHQPSASSHVTQRPGQRRRKTGGVGHDDNETSAIDTDWLLRAGALISTETRESKGQSWLVSRASSVSLAGSDPERTEEEAHLAREREYFASRHASRRGSLNADEPVYGPSPSASRLGSRSQSRTGSRGGLMTPSEQRRSVDGYFAQHAHNYQHVQLEDEDDENASYVAGPDFVSLDTKLEAVEPDTSYEDEAHVRRLVKNGGAGAGTWFGNVLGWGLFSVEENEEESDDDGEREAGDDDDSQAEGDAVEFAADGRRRSTARHFEGISLPVQERIPPPKADEGGWQDAAWLLSVASKVLL